VMKGLASLLMFHPCPIHVMKRPTSIVVVVVLITNLNHYWIHILHYISFFSSICTLHELSIGSIWFLIFRV
jgi:hypothetical protein